MSPLPALDVDFLSETTRTSAVEALVLVLGVRRRGPAAAVRLVEGSQRAVFVAVEGDAALQGFAAHPAPRAVLGAQGRAVAPPRVRDVAVLGLPTRLPRAPGPRLVLLAFLVLG